MKLLNDLYQYRELLKTNVKKDIRGKYKGSVLGVLWSFLNPLLMVAVYAIVFPLIMKTQTKHYLVFLIVGIIPWNFFTVAMAQGVPIIKNNEGIIKKVYFPREILPISTALSGLVNFFISCIIILAFCLGDGLGISWHILLVPFIAFLEFFIIVGLVLAFSSINVYIKDIEYIIQFVINMFFYGTPILYNLTQFEDVPSILIQIVNLNPFTHLITMYRDVFMYHQLPAIGSILYVMFFAIFCFFVGLAIFRRLEKGFAEEI